MNTVLLWLLVSISDGGSNRGNIVVIERFATVEDCEHVRKNLPMGAYVSNTARCIQANVIRP